jgi:uncharacterized membrane protein
VIVVLAVLLLGPCLATSSARVDPDTGRIRTLFIGSALVGIGYPAPAMVEDPKIELTRVEAQIGSSNPLLGFENMQRFLRLYLPRSEDDLLQNYDMLIVTGIRSDDLKMSFQRWAKKAVEEEGFGLMMADDATAFGTTATVFIGNPGQPWDTTPVGEALPVYQTEHVTYRDHFFKILPTGPNPITDGISWKGMPFIWSTNRVEPRPGSTVIAVTTDETVLTDRQNDEVLVYWDYGAGRSLAFVFNWCGHGLIDFYRWEYWKDLVARLVYFPARASIPDVSISHKIRLQIGLYTSQKGTLLSIMEFADTFGANTYGLNQNLAGTEGIRRKADELWIDEQYEESSLAMDGALSSLTRDMEEAVKAKDRALLWVYVVEWLTVTGTSLATGMVLWSVMVRRRLYRETGTTSAQSLKRTTSE